MKKSRISAVVGLVGGAAFLAVACLLQAADNQGAQPNAKAISNCNSAVVQCVEFCQGSQDSATRSKCEDNCLTKWNRCMDAAGAPKANRVPPIKKRPVDGGRVPVSGVKPTSSLPPRKVPAGEIAPTTTRPATKASPAPAGSP